MIPLRLAALTATAISAAPSGKGWYAAMERAIAQGHTAAWLAGTAERLGVKPGGALLSERRLSRAERADIKAQVAAQLRYLEGFAAAREGMSEAAIRTRAELYALSVQATYHQARWGDWELPFTPCDGSSECLGRCRCSASVADNGDGSGVYTWVLGQGAAERHCATCPGRAGDHPVRRRGAAVKALDEWDDSEIDLWDDDPAWDEPEVKHGAHDQSSHGRRGPRGGASRAAYSSARAGGASVVEARAAARDVSEAYVARQRIANIDKQLDGQVSESRRASLQAERGRLTQEIAVRAARTPAAQEAQRMDLLAPTVRGRAAPPPPPPPPKAKRTAKPKAKPQGAAAARVQAEEARIRQQRFESAFVVAPDGTVLLKKDGQATSVSFSKAEVAKLRGQNVIMTHNHPLGWEVPASDPRRAGNSFSPEDIQFAANVQAAEMRAVTPTRTFIMRPPPGGWSEEYHRTTIEPARRRADAAVRQDFTARIQSQRLRVEEAEASHHHEVWLRVSKELGLDYSIVEG